MNRSLHARNRPFNVGRSWSRVLALLVAGSLFGMATIAAVAVDRRPSPPEVSFSFESLNVPGLSPNFLGAGASMMTLNFVDSNHLLLSYGLRELVPRLVGDPPEDDDRLVGAELVELPSGKVLAKARWHLHDHGRYLWSLNDGRFLLREGDELYTFAPLANLATKEPFQRISLPHRPGLLDAVVVSPDGKLLTLETHKPEKKKLTGTNINVLTSGDLVQSPPVITYDFYRLSGSGAPSAPIETVRSGSVHATGVLRLPIDGDGYLIATGGKRGRWNVEFESFSSGKSTLVGVVESNCQPGLQLVSPTQYLAFTCRAVHTDTVTVAAYDFAKNDIWEEPMGSFEVYPPVFAFAPPAGRFAISRKIDTPTPAVGGNAGGEITTQEIRVYGTQTGDLLMKTYCMPVFRTSENFDLSPDGMRLGVIRNGNIEIYHLPELTKLDRADLADLAKLTPAPGAGPVNLHRMAHEAAAEAQQSVAAADADVVPAEDTTTAATALAPAAAPVQQNAPSAAASPGLASDSTGPKASPSGDMEVRRKPPTLLNPGETAEGGGSKTKAQPQQN